MFKKGKIFIVFAVMLCIVLQIFTFTASAANKASIAITDTKPLVGSTITITFNFTMDRAIGSVDSQSNIKYDKNVLECVSNPTDTYIPSAGSINISWYNTNNKTTKIAITIIELTSFIIVFLTSIFLSIL